MSNNKLQCYYCKTVINEDELLHETEEKDNVYNDICPKCGKRGAFYELKNFITKDGKVETLTFATRL